MLRLKTRLKPALSGPEVIEVVDFAREAVQNGRGHLISAVETGFELVSPEKFRFVSQATCRSRKEAGFGRVSGS